MREVSEVLRYDAVEFLLFSLIDRASRVLRPGGIFLYLTFGQPHFRKRYLIRPDTKLEIRQLGEAFHYYLYIVRRE